MVKLFNSKGDEIGIDNRIHIQDQFNRFRKVHFESFNSRLTVDQEKDLIANGGRVILHVWIKREQTTVILSIKTKSILWFN